MNGSAVGSAIELLLGAMFLAADAQCAHARRTGGTWVRRWHRSGDRDRRDHRGPRPVRLSRPILLTLSVLVFLAGLVLLLIKRRRASHHVTREPPL